MLFPSIEFAYFFLFVFTVYWLLPRRTPQKWFLLFASYYFYAGWDYKLLLLLWGSSSLNWLVGEGLTRTKAQTQRRILLWVGICINIGLLALFKYFDFFRASFDTVASWLGLSAHLPLFQLLLPIGMSFYTFQGIAYIVDLHREKGYKARSYLDFLLFIALFPQFLAGPICRSHELLPQLASEPPRYVKELSRGVALILSGLFKKAVLATVISTQLTADAFISPDQFTTPALYVAVFAYTAQIYLDFSGYTDMARGFALLLGFELPVNFNGPYTASNIGEYWRRWHMTFSSWLREYIYFPLGGSRVGRWRCYLNLMITFVICGIWHGLSWTFVLWGGIHGLGLSVYKAYVDLQRDFGLDPKRQRPWWWLVLGWATTLSFCAFARIFFCSPDMTTNWLYWSRLLQWDMTGRSYTWPVVLATLLGILLNFIGPTLYKSFVAFHERTPAWGRPLIWLVCFLVFAWLKPTDMSPFAYFRY